MKRILWSITKASLSSLVAYLALYFIWGAILGDVENEKIRLFLIALMTTCMSSFFLLLFRKISKGVGSDEVLSDYKDRDYVSFFDDCKLVLKKEAKCLVTIAIIIMACFALNTFDSVVFGKKVISFPTFLFAPLCIFDTFFDVAAVGYIVNAILIPITYVPMVALYRRKQYFFWKGKSNK